MLKIAILLLSVSCILSQLSISTTSTTAPTLTNSALYGSTITFTGTSWAISTALTGETTFYVTLSNGAATNTGFGPATVVDNVACTTLPVGGTWVNTDSVANLAGGCYGDILSFYNAQPTGSTSTATTTDLITAGTTYEVQVTPPSSTLPCGQIGIQSVSSATATFTTTPFNNGGTCGSAPASHFSEVNTASGGGDTLKWGIYFEQESATGTSVWCIQDAAQATLSFGNCNSAYTIVKSLFFGVATFLGITLFI